MENIPYKWQQADGNKSFVFALNEKLTNEFCFFVQACKKGRAEEVATLACAAPVLLDELQKLSAAYELLCYQIDENPNVNMHYRSAIAAIAAAKGDL